MTALRLKQQGVPGLLITFCGLDGCGKTTTIRMLKQELERRGHAVYLTKQPTDAVRKSEIFRTFMDCPEHDGYDYRALSLMAASDRIQHSNQVILPLLRQGEHRNQRPVLLLLPGKPAGQGIRAGPLDL